ncbi:MAG TPA: hypothetical protein VGO45_06010 [Bacteroidia bacterium]|jgi:uncharacterized integral membrane protein|nr:hypothetical protein [Bacteroidia bacterium]
MKKFTIHIGGFALSEPVTAVSDLLLGMLCLFIIISLQKSKRNNPAVTLWQIFFFGMGLSTLTGVIVHGLREYQSETGNHSTWMFMNVISGASVYFAQLATAQSILKDFRFKKLFVIIANAQALAYLLCISFVSGFSFNAVIIQIAAGMIPVMIFHFSASGRNKPGATWIGTGISLSFLSAVARTTKMSLDPDWFNYNDISHIFIAASFIVMFRGISMSTTENRALQPKTEF